MSQVFVNLFEGDDVSCSAGKSCYGDCNCNCNTCYGCNCNCNTCNCYSCYDCNNDCSATCYC